MCKQKASRKRYRNKKKSADKHAVNKRLKTHMNVEAYQQQQEDQSTAMMQAASQLQHTTGMPQIQDRLEKTCAPIRRSSYGTTKTCCARYVNTTSRNAPCSHEDEEDEDSIELNFENAGLGKFCQTD